MRIWLDDIRPAPPGWEPVRNYREFVDLVNEMTYNITHISFDHDLGEYLTGYDCATYLEGHLHFDERWPVPVMTCHSRNLAGRKRIELVFKAIERRKG